MNLLAKHFFDYQSFVNLPHKSVQLHKTPPSQAGMDPSAAWAPKSMRVAGKNQAAPAARANRSRVEARTGGHRHGRPNKLEFRNWGDRHGELHAEKTVPHKDEWMINLKGNFKHFYEYDESFGSDGVDSAIQHFPTFSQRCVKVGDLEVLTILTFTGHADTVMITIKAIRGYLNFKNRPLVKVQLFEDGHLLDERRSELCSSSKFFAQFHEKNCRLASLPLMSKAADYVPIISSLSPPRQRYVEKSVANRRRESHGIGKIAEAQIPRPIRQFRTTFQAQDARKKFHSMANFWRHASHVQNTHDVVPPSFININKNPIRVLLNHNGGPATSYASQVKTALTARTHVLSHKKPDSLPRGFSFDDIESHNWFYHRSSSFDRSNIAVVNNTTDGANCNNSDVTIDVSESFMFRVPHERLAQCHLLVQIFTCAHSTAPSPPPSSLNIRKEAESILQIHRALSEYFDDNSDEEYLILQNHMTSPSTLALSAAISQKFSDNKECLRSAHVIAENLVNNSLNCAIIEIFDMLKGCQIPNNLLKVEKNIWTIDKSKNARSNLNDLNRIETEKFAFENLQDPAKENFFQTNDQKTQCENQQFKQGSIERLNYERSPEFSSKTSMNSVDSIIEELKDGGASAVLQYSDCGCTCDNEFSECSDASSSTLCAPASFAATNLAHTQRKNAKFTNSSDAIAASNISSEQRQKSTRNVLVGGYVIGALGSSRGRWHWRQTMQRQGHPVFMWHRIVKPQEAAVFNPGTTKTKAVSMPNASFFQSFQINHPSNAPMQRCHTIDMP